MALSQHIWAAIAREVHRAREILNNDRSTDSQRSVARLVLSQWGNQ